MIPLRLVMEGSRFLELHNELWKKNFDRNPRVNECDDETLNLSCSRSRPAIPTDILFDTLKWLKLTELAAVAPTNRQFSVITSRILSNRFHRISDDARLDIFGDGRLMFRRIGGGPGETTSVKGLQNAKCLVIRAVLHIKSHESAEEWILLLNTLKGICYVGVEIVTYGHYFHRASHLQAVVRKIFESKCIYCAHTLTLSRASGYRMIPYKFFELLPWWNEHAIFIIDGASLQFNDVEPLIDWLESLNKYLVIKNLSTGLISQIYDRMKKSSHKGACVVEHVLVIGDYRIITELFESQ